MSGVSSEGPALVCTGVGYFPWRADNGEIVLVKCFYSEQAADTIISPTDIVVNNITNVVISQPYNTTMAPINITIDPLVSPIADIAFNAGQLSQIMNSIYII